MKTRFPQIEFWRSDYKWSFIFYSIQASVELGQLKEASAIASRPLPTSVRPTAEAVAYREKAALHLALGEYEAAVSEASRAAAGAKNHHSAERYAYAGGLHALALLRLGRVADAEKPALNAAGIGSRIRKPDSFYVPRTFYSACLVEAHLAKHAAAEQWCASGLAIAKQESRETRDLALGYLASSEAALEKGDIMAAREFAVLANSVTLKLFGPMHQDAITGLVLLARINFTRNDRIAARRLAGEARRTALTFFGENSPGLASVNNDLREIDAAQ